MKIIVAYDLNRAIGKNGELIWHNKEDLKRFKKLTLNSNVVMGRKTFEDIGRPLDKRKNIILSRNSITIISEFEKDILSYSEEHFKDLLKLIGDAWIIGGEDIYKLFLPYCEEIYATEILTHLEGDKFFPKLNNLEWFEETRENKIGFDFVKYKRFENAKNL